MDNLLTVQSMSDLACVLGVPKDVLKPYCFHLVPGAYRSFEIPKKKGGSRKILRPNDELMAIQRSLVHLLSQIYKPHHAVHSFVPSRNVLTNALCHVGQDWVFRLDIKDFFPSIKFRHVRRTLIHSGLKDDIATMVAKLCTYQECLPQGAPTSPVLSNMVFQRCDVLIMQLCSKLNCVYTRYADDLTFSHSRSVMPSEIHRTSDTQGAHVVAGDAVVAILAKSGFAVNDGKVQLVGKREKQEVVGIVVNPIKLGGNTKSSLSCSLYAGAGPVALSRSKLRFIRSALYRIENLGRQNAEAWYAGEVMPNRGKRDEASLLKHLAGSLSYAVMINGLRHQATKGYVAACKRLVPEIDINFESINEYRLRAIAGSGAALKVQNAMSQVERISFDSFLTNNGVVDFENISERDRERILSAYCKELCRRIHVDDLSSQEVLGELGLNSSVYDPETIRDLAGFVMLRKNESVAAAAIMFLSRAVENELNVLFSSYIKPHFRAKDMKWRVRKPPRLITTLRGVKEASNSTLTLGQYPYLAQAILEHPRVRVLGACHDALKHAYGATCGKLLQSIHAMRIQDLVEERGARSRFISLRNKSVHPANKKYAKIVKIDKRIVDAALAYVTGEDGVLTLLGSRRAR